MAGLQARECARCPCVLNGLLASSFHRKGVLPLLAHNVCHLLEHMLISPNLRHRAVLPGHILSAVLMNFRSGLPLALVTSVSALWRARFGALHFSVSCSCGLAWALTCAGTTGVAHHRQSPCNILTVATQPCRVNLGVGKLQWPLSLWICHGGFQHNVLKYGLACSPGSGHTVTVWPKPVDARRSNASCRLQCAGSTPQPVDADHASAPPRVQAWLHVRSKDWERASECPCGQRTVGLFDLVGNCVCVCV